MGLATTWTACGLQDRGGNIDDMVPLGRDLALGLH